MVEGEMPERHKKKSMVCQIRSEIGRQHRKLRRHKKGSVLHLRIEDDLMARIKQEAKAREMSISNLVRNYLAIHFGPGPEESERPAFLDETYGWGDVVLARDTHCVLCEKDLPAYSHAWIAQGPPPPVRTICGDCYDEMKLRTFETDKV
jgi:hypothetical protein